MRESRFPMTKKSYLTVDDVARIFTDELQKKALRGVTVAPVKAATVTRYVRFSRPARPGSKPNRYQGTPMPMPQYVPGEIVFSPGRKPIKSKTPVTMMIWRPDQEPQLRHWFSEERKGQGAGGGRPWPKR